MSKISFPCQICSLAQFKYTCPRCNIQYCSVNCYKSQGHGKCSEEFYKSCIQEELSSTKSNNTNDVKKMYEILERFRKTDSDFDPANFDNASAEPSNYDDDMAEPLDSDDDSVPDEEEEADLADRLSGVDINNADEVWTKLTENERKDFLSLTKSGAIMNLIPKFKAWWYVKSTSKIVEITDNNKTHNKEIPEIIENIPKYSSLCKKEPSPFLHYNMWNILSAYTAVVRYFGGEHQAHAFEAMAQLVNLSSALKYDTNFENATDAINSVEVESKTSLEQTTGTALSIIESPAKMQEDVRQIMSKLDFKLAALSDILKLVGKAKQQVKNATPEETAMQKLFAVTSGCEVLNKLRLNKYLRKFEFLLCYVNRENEVNL